VGQKLHGRHARRVGQRESDAEGFGFFRSRSSPFLTAPLGAGSSHAAREAGRGPPLATRQVTLLAGGATALSLTWMVRLLAPTSFVTTRSNRFRKTEPPPYAG
jgi:hypothetical protein